MFFLFFFLRQNDHSFNFLDIKHAVASTDTSSFSGLGGDGAIGVYQSSNDTHINNMCINCQICIINYI